MINVSAVVVRDSKERVLTVRKRGTDRFMLPGGKPEPGESAVDTAVREVREELGVALDRHRLALLGSFRAPAANEAGESVEATVFVHPPIDVTAPRAEIAELAWHSPDAQHDGLAPLLSGHVLPVLRTGRGGLGRVAVFTGSASGASAVFADSAAAFAQAIAELGVDVVYGGGKVGLMGVLADAALAAGVDVHGVMPRSLVDGEIAHRALSRLDVVGSMHERKARMAELADGFVALPGGAGTLEELFEVWTWQQLGLHSKPVALFNVDGFWDPLMVMLAQMRDRAFLSAAFLDGLIVETDPYRLIRRMAAWSPLAPKWSRAAHT